MGMSTNQNRVSEPYRDLGRERSFKQSYGKDAVITVVNTNDKNWDWVEVSIKFEVNGHKYLLIETFNDGEDNSTKEVILKSLNNGCFENKVFNRFIDAELTLVSIIQEKEEQNGDTG